MPAFEEWIENLCEEANKILESQPDSFNKSDFFYDESLLISNTSQTFCNESSNNEVV